MPLIIQQTHFFTAVSRRLIVGVIALHMLAAPLPAFAETAAAPAIEPAPAAVEPAKTEPVPPLLSQPLQSDRITGEYVISYFTDTGKILASPVNWDRYDWMKAGLVIGATSGLMLVDADIRDFARRNQTSLGNKAAAFENSLGNPLYTLPPFGLFYLYGHIYDDPKARQTSLLAAESLAISGAFAWTLKVTTQRPRPFTGATPGTWNGPSSKMSDYSFPSGHATAAFSVASVLAEEYGTNPYVPPIVYGLATLTGFARVYGDKHWASDVFFGGAIGYFVGKAVVRYHTVLGDAPLTILPTISQQGFGVMAEYRF